MVNCTRNVQFHFAVSTGKERDEETGYGYFGARYMDHELMTGWLSVDPMADKYPSISPYAYCAWNPIMILDPSGDTLFALDEDSQNDIRNIAEMYSDRILFDNRGVASIDYSGMNNMERKEMENHSGVKMISDIATANKKILYEATVMARIVEMDGSRGIQNLFTVITGIVNLSKGGLDSQNGYHAMPREDYDGQICIMLYGEWTSKGEVVSRNEIVLHELAENYARTVFNCNYQPMESGSEMQQMGAHVYANKRFNTLDKAYTYHKKTVPEWKKQYYQKQCKDYYEH